MISRQNTVMFVIHGEMRGHIFQVKQEEWIQKLNRFYIVDPDSEIEYAEFQVRKVDIPCYYNVIPRTAKRISEHVGICQVQSTIDEKIINYLIVEEVDNVVFLNANEFQNLMIYKDLVRIEK